MVNTAAELGFAIMRGGEIECTICGDTFNLKGRSVRFAHDIHMSREHGHLGMILLGTEMVFKSFE